MDNVLVLQVGVFGPCLTFSVRLEFEWITINILDKSSGASRRVLGKLAIIRGGFWLHLQIKSSNVPHGTCRRTCTAL